MKILTGRLRGQTILFKPNPHLRPTADKARKAVFDMLQGALAGRSALDLFCGTGAMGLEALSQDASHVTFVEHDREQCRRLEKNLQKLGLETSAEIAQENVSEWLVRQGPGSGPFDFIFIDPPYAAGLAEKTLKAVSAGGLLSPGGFAVLECRIREDLPVICGRLKVVREKRYGQTKILVYAARPESSEALR